MGPSVTMSENTTNITNNMINDISNNMTKDCGVNSVNTQTIKISLRNIDNCSLDMSNISQGMNSTVSLDCAQSSVTATDLETALKNAVDQLAESTKSAGTLSILDVTTTKNFTDLKNTVTNKNVINNLMRAINNSTNSQNNDITIDGFRCFPVTTRDIYGNVTTTGDILKFGNITQQLMSNVVAKALQNSDDLVKAVQKVDNEISQTAKSTNKGLFESIGDMMSGFAGAMIALIVLICVVGAVVSYVVFGKGKGSGDGGGGGVQSGLNYTAILKKTKMTCIGGMFLCSIAFAVSLYATLSQKAYANSAYAKDKGKINQDALDAQLRPMVLSSLGGGLIGIIAIMTIIAYIKPEWAINSNSKVTWSFILILIFFILTSLAFCGGAIADEFTLVQAQNEAKDSMINTKK
jgi:hypothetical protein